MGIICFGQTTSRRPVRRGLGTRFGLILELQCRLLSKLNVAEFERVFG